MSTFGDDLIQSLNEALAHSRGEGPAAALLWVMQKEPEAVPRALTADG